MATASDDVLPRLNYSAACPVCFLILHKPRSLPCGHTFCLDCIERILGQRYDAYGVEVSAMMAMRCPVCRHSIQTSVEALPVNFAVQDMIADLIRSSDGLCRSCFKCRKLERATARCEDCHETLCGDCVVEGGHEDHRLGSMVKKCDEHDRILELYCFRCDANICVACFSEDHERHKCRAISKLAEEHTASMQRDIDRLRDCELRAREVLRVVRSQKVQYERYFGNMEERDKAETRGRRFRETLETFKAKKRREVVEGFIGTKMKAIDAVDERHSRGKHVDQGHGRRLLQDVGSVLHVLIVDLGNQAGLLEKFASSVEELKTRAYDALRRCSSSIYDVTENTSTVLSVHDQIISLLERNIPAEEDPRLIYFGTGDTTVPILSSEGHDEVEELLERTTVLRELLHYEEIPVSSNRGIFGRIFGKKKGQRPQDDEHLQSGQARYQSNYGPHTSGQRPPAVSAKHPESPRREKEEQPQSQRRQRQVPVSPTSLMMDELRDRLAERESQRPASSSTTVGQAAAHHDRYSSTTSNGEGSSVQTELSEPEDTYIWPPNLPISSASSNDTSHAILPGIPDTDEDEYTYHYGPLLSSNPAVLDDDVYDDLPIVQDNRTPDTLYRNLPQVRDTHNSDRTDDDNDVDTYEEYDDIEELLTSHPSLSGIPDAHDVSEDETPEIANSLEVLAVYAFYAAEDNEITLHIGDIITDVQDVTEDENWLYGTAPDGTCGYFPSSFVTYVVD